MNDLHILTPTQIREAAEKLQDDIARNGGEFADSFETIVQRINAQAQATDPKFALQFRMWHTSEDAVEAMRQQLRDANWNLEYSPPSSGLIAKVLVTPRPERGVCL